jgi:membrane protein YqaA with SNARE-associated domain
MKEFVDQMVEWGPLGVFLLSLIDSAGIPLPSFVDAYLVAVVMRNPPSALPTMLAAIAGSLIGNIILYRLARKGGQLYLDKFTNTSRGHKFRHWFDKYGLVTIFVPAVSVIPMPLKFFAVSAAVFKVPLLRVLAVIALARVIRYGFIAWLAAYYGPQTIEFVNHHKLGFGLGALALGAIFYVGSRYLLKPPTTSSEELSA